MLCLGGEDPAMVRKVELVLPCGNGDATRARCGGSDVPPFRERAIVPGGRNGSYFGLDFVEVELRSANF